MSDRGWRYFFLRTLGASVGVAVHCDTDRKQDVWRRRLPRSVSKNIEATAGRKNKNQKKGGAPPGSRQLLGPLNVSPKNALPPDEAQILNLAFSVSLVYGFQIEIA